MRTGLQKCGKFPFNVYTARKCMSGSHGAYAELNTLQNVCSVILSLTLFRINLLFRIYHGTGIPDFDQFRIFNNTLAYKYSIRWEH